MMLDLEIAFFFSFFPLLFPQLLVLPHEIQMNESLFAELICLDFPKGYPCFKKKVLIRPHKQH